MLPPCRIHPEIAYALHSLASTVGSLERLGEAESLLVEALAMRRRLLEETHPDVMAGALTIRTAALGSENFRTAETMRALGENLMAMGRYEEAESLLVASHRVLSRDASQGLAAARADRALASLRQRRSR